VSRIVPAKITASFTTVIALDEHEQISRKTNRKRRLP